MRNPSPRIHKTTPYKSELCLLYQKNKCYKGERCHFAHSINELSNRNGVYKSGHCYWSFSGKQCPFGYRCHYLHINECMGVRNQSLPTKKDESRSEEHRVLSTGHVWSYKMRLCGKWERFGWCCYGVKCIYAHGQEELDAHTKKLYLPELETPTKKLQVKGPGWMGWSVEKTGESELDAHTKKLYLPKLETRIKKLQVKSHSWMGWSAEKIGRIYGDWIDSMDVIQCPTS